MSRMPDADPTRTKAGPQGAQGEQFTALVRLLEESGDAVVLVDADDRVTYWSTLAESLLGHRADSALGRPLSELLAHLSAARRLAIMTALIRSNENAVTAGLALVRSAPRAHVKDAAYHVFLDAAPDAIVVADESGQIVLVNPQAERLFGWKSAEMIGQPIEILVPERYRRDHPRHRAGYFADPRVRGMGSGLSLFGLRKDRSEFPVEISLSPLDTDSGILVMSAIRDITDRRRAEEQVRAMSQYARSLIEASLDPLVTISREGKITDVNEATVAVTGMQRETLIGTDFSDYFTEPDAARAGYRETFSRGAVTDYPLTIRDTTGRLTPVLYNSTVYRDAEGAILGILAAARDVTAQRRAEEEVAKQRALELDRLAELERFQRLTVGRELKMIELKREIEELKRRLES